MGVEPVWERFEEGMPPWLEQAFSAGHVTVAGKEYPRVFPTRSTSPVSTPWELLGSAVNRPGSESVREYLNPGIETAFRIAGHESPYGRDVGSYPESIRQNVERLLPQADLVRDVISPPEEGGLYPEDTTCEGRIKRALRIFPIAVDPEEAYKARVREGMVSQEEQTQKRVDDAREAVEKLGTKGLKLSDESREQISDAVQAQALRYEAYNRIEKETEPGPERERMKNLAVVRALNAAGHMSRQEAQRLSDYYTSQEGLTVDELRDDRRYLWDNAAGADYAWLSEQAKARGIKLPSWR